MMSTFEDMYRYVTVRYNDKIKKVCGPFLDYFNLNQFYYCSISNSGYLSYFDSNVAWSEYFNDEKFYLTYPFYQHPKYYQEGSFVIKDVENKDLMRVIDAGKEKFNFQLWLRIIKRTPEGIEEFGFSSSSRHEKQVDLFMNELALIYLFVEKFRINNSFLFDSLSESKINMADMLGPAFYQNSMPIVRPSKDKKKLLLQSMGIQDEQVLSAKEIEVVKQLLKGYSASQIACRVYLSKRTVEHYIERIKEKLRCDSKAELIQKGRELELLGCFGSFSSLNFAPRYKEI